MAGVTAVTHRINEIQAQFAPRVADASKADFATTYASARSTNGPATGSAQQVIDLAKSWVGTPYVYGGNDPQRGIDCSGLVQQAFKRVGVDLPRVTYDQVKQGTAVPDLAHAQPGDLVFTVGDRGRQVNGHVGIYLGDGKWIEAPYTGERVRIRDVPKNITAIRRVLPGPAGVGGLS